MATEQGWIFNTSDEAHDRLVERDTSRYPPAFRLDDGTPIFEVWFWHGRIGRWFVMSNYSDPQLVNQGVIYFQPGNAKIVARWYEEERAA